jgi:hypothetical protein
LGRTRMSQMVEIKGIGNQALQVFICIPMLPRESI